jgi:5'/3'-nucleotidase SurE
MRILITNDDGINAPGLEVLTAIAEEIAGPQGEVWTVAPAFEQSGVGHCISYTHPMMIAALARAALPPRAARPIACWPPSTTCWRAPGPIWCCRG